MFNLKANPRWVPKVLTNCKLCKLPIIQGQEYVWLTKPMGMSHKECTS